MDDIERAKQHYFNVAKGMGYVPDSDKDLEFQYSARLLSYGGPTTQYPQVRIWSEVNGEAEVTVWTMVNSACTIPKGKATLRAGTNRVDISWSEYNEDGASNMSADLWELHYHFKNLPGAECFDYVMVRTGLDQS